MSCMQEMNSQSEDKSIKTSGCGNITVITRPQSGKMRQSQAYSISYNETLPDYLNN